MSRRDRDNQPTPTDCKVYVGNLGEYGNRKELEDAFSFYGPLKNVWVALHPPGFAFVEFLNSDDAHDSVRGLNDTVICGRRVDVEHATGQKRRGNSYGGGGGGGGSGGGGRYPQRRSNNDDKCYECGERGHFARDCHLNRRNSKRSRSRSRDRYNSRSKRHQSRSASRSRSRSRSRSYHSPQRN